MVFMKTPEHIKKELAEKAKRRRLDMNLSQQGLADRSGVRIATLRVFERQGKISLENLLKLAVVLEELQAFSDLFNPRIAQATLLDDILMDDTKRKRGRIK